MSGIWGTVLGWPAAGLLVSVLIGAGFSVAATAPAEPAAAYVCFSIAASVLFLKTGLWIATASLPATQRFLASFFILGLIGAAWAWSLAWVSSHASRAAVVAPEVPSLDVIFDATLGREAFNLFNHGRSNLYLWGTKLGSGPRTMEGAPRLITPGGSYHIWAQSNAAEMRQKLGANGETRVNLELYVSLEDRTKYVLTYQLWIRVRNSSLAIETQNLGFKKSSWTTGGDH